MSTMGSAEPIKLGFLIDYIGDSSSMDDHSIFSRPLELVFNAGYESGMIDRPVEVVFRSAQGLPRGNVKAVIDAFGELVDEGCLAVIGPHISDNTVVVRPEIERRFRVPAISVCGSEHWLGEWTFLLNNGSMTDEPILWAHLMAKADQPTAGVLVERSYIGKEYLANFRRAALLEGVQIVAEEPIAQTGQDISAAVAALHDAGAERDRALRLRARRGRDQRRAARARLGSAALHGHRVRDRLQRAPLGRVPRMDRARAVRRGQRRRAAIPRRVRSGLRRAARVLRPAAVA